MYRHVCVCFTPCGTYLKPKRESLDIDPPKIWFCLRQKKQNTPTILFSCNYVVLKQFQEETICFRRVPLFGLECFLKIKCSLLYFSFFFSLHFILFQYFLKGKLWLQGTFLLHMVCTLLLLLLLILLLVLVRCFQYVPRTELSSDSKGWRMKKEGPNRTHSQTRANHLKWLL